MGRLWAPWRIEYIMGEKNRECIFCQKPKEHKDEKNFILLRGKKCMAMLNIFPYNNGHLLIAPYRHIGSIEELSKEESEELMSILTQMVKLLKKVLHPAGFNIGMNLGRVAGAGIEDHLHIHIVPRWRGDSNFMPVISETKVISEALQKTYQKLKENL
ncbi:MAG: HIT domain-containing protein [Candidatus Aerophobetes bacterium]|nr:HIT domain-containing protein [Candidatus Aerophobetes bacterium]